MSFGERLKKLRIEHNFTQQKLSKLIGVTTVTIRSWENNTKKPTMGALVSLAMAYEISLDELVDFQPKSSFILSSSEKKLISSYRMLDSFGKKTVDTICSIEKERVLATNHKPHIKIIDRPNSDRFIPKYYSPSAAGVSVPLDGEDFEMVLVDNSVPDDADYAVNIQGNSMYPYICDGDMVYVKKDAELSVGDVGIFCVDGAMYCKQYFIDNDNNLILVSANPELRHTNVLVSADSGSNVKFCGKVLLDQKIELPRYIFED